MTNIIMQGATTVPIKTLKPHPLNARHGNTDLIAESLTNHGQYRPVVINQDNTILAGHHVVQAAKNLGWKDIAIVQVNVSDRQAQLILLADNRTADLGSYDENTLLELIESLPDLEGTGFGASDIQALDSIIHGDLPDTTEPTTPTEPDPLSPTVPYTLGPLYTAEFDRNAYEQWVQDQYPDTSRARRITAMKNDLGIPTLPKPGKQPPKISHESTTVPLSYLQSHPNNPRQGDIGAICQSLETNGQYRPIIVNKVTGHIVAGNHTFLAAKALGWERIAVHWIAVDEEEETKILLIDNRTADLATYDTNALKTILKDLNPYLQGTGYTPEEAEAIINGTSPTRPGPAPTGQTRFKIGDHGWRIPTDTYDQWADGLDMEHTIQRLRIPPGALS